MAAYTRLSSEDIQEILSMYSLPGLKAAEPLSLGISNSNYRLELDSGDTVILKVSNDKGVEEMKEEQEILLALEEFPYSLAPLKTAAGEGVYLWNGLYGAVFPFVEGSKPMGSTEEISLLGQALGALHVFGQDRGFEKRHFRCHSKVGFDLEGILEYCEQGQAVEEFQSACSELLAPEEIAAWKQSELPQGIIHGDLYMDNTLYKNGKLQVLLDFEQAGIGCLLQDIGISISGSCLDKEGVSKEKIQAFVEGYEKSRPLEKMEKDLLNFSITLGFLDISLWRIKRFYEGDLDANKRDSYKELLELARSFKNSIL